MADLMFHCPACGAALIAHPIVVDVEVHRGLGNRNPNRPPSAALYQPGGYVSVGVSVEAVAHDCDPGAGQ